MAYVRSTLIIVLVGLVVIFILQNTERLNVEFLFWSFSLRRALLLFIVLLVGIITGYALAAFRRGRAAARQAKSGSDDAR
jgi:uncharacterized integral membrane protein